MYIRGVSVRRVSNVRGVIVVLRKARLHERMRWQN